MSRLMDRYPNVPVVQLPDGSDAAPEALLNLIEPYLNWVLVDMDTFPTDLLLREPKEPTSQQNFVIVTGPVVDTWLQHQEGASL